MMFSFSYLVVVSTIFNFTIHMKKCSNFNAGADLALKWGGGGGGGQKIMCAYAHITSKKQSSLWLGESSGVLDAISC